MSLLSMCCFVKKKKKKRIVQILFPCTLPQTENCCPTTVYRNLQCTSLLIYFSGVLHRHTIESCVFFTVMLVIVFTVILMLFYCVFFIVYWSVIFYECIWFYLTVSESDIIKLFNLYIDILHIQGYSTQVNINNMAYTTSMSNHLRKRNKQNIPGILFRL